MSLAPRPQEMRRAERHEVCYRCEIADAGPKRVSALMVDISALGCMMRSSHPFAQGAVLSFPLPRYGKCEARVVWAIGGRVGLEFIKPIDAAPFLAMLTHLVRPGDELDIY
jgi:hypothetical protein